MPWIPWQAQAQLDDAMKMYTHTHIRAKRTMHNVGCTARRRRKKKTTRRKEERMTYNITESLSVALKLFTKKTTQEH